MKQITKYINKGSLALVLISGSLSSCRKFVEVPPPTTQLVTASVFNDPSTATAAQINIYFQMWNLLGSYYISENLGIYSDELQSYASSDLVQSELYTNALIPTASTQIKWPNYYTYIYIANAVINGLQTASGVTSAVNNQLTGEALFVRAYWHFYLTNIYGDVPLVLSTDYTMNQKLSRVSRLQVLRQVVTDLQQAQGLLNSNYVDASDTASTTERVRPNKAAAAALMARAYQYLGDYSKDASQYANAEAQATAVIGNNFYSLSPLNAVFLKNSNEAIWQLQTPSNAQYDTFDGFGYILLSAPAANGSLYSTSLSVQLLNAFETGDQRLNNWVGTYTTTALPTATYYFPYKYKNRTLKNQEYNMVLRLGEQYLIRAEARAQQGNTNGAIADLNMIRNRAGLPNYAGATDKASLLAAILHERQVELFSEWGHRWFDLCRSGNANPVMSVVTPQKGGTWSMDGHQLLFPIPQNDIINDPNLTQNPGY